MSGDGFAYKPISDYAAIGNLRTVALIARDGSLDWCCLPELSNDAVFAALLDHRRGGTFRVFPTLRGDLSPPVRQSYVRDTNVLETCFLTERGRLVVTDFMPLEGTLDGVGKSQTRPEVVRVIRAMDGPVSVDVVWSPRPGFARTPPRISLRHGGAVAYGATGERIALAGLPVPGSLVDDGYGPALHARFELHPGRPLVLVTRWNAEETRVHREVGLAELETTIDTWRTWVYRDAATGARSWAAPYSEQVVRSELVLKLLTHNDTGAIAAAATTSLPETLGGVRNWDYRYTWIRDASLTIQALAALGHTYAASDFFHFLHEASEAQEETHEGLRIMYGLHGESDLKEVELTHLSGYGGSRPVRSGNEASIQTQHDVYGELLTAAYELVRRGEILPRRLWSFLGRVADLASDCWELPDAGIWEFRDDRHFIHSKGMVWVALDRALHLREIIGLPGDVERWRRVAREARRYTVDVGFNRELGAFVQAAGARDLDAANLRLALLELLPIHDPRVQSTVDRTLTHLTCNGLVYRYRNDDGFPGKEGAFGITTCWLISVLALSGRLDEAVAIFDGLLGRANHVNLFSEQIDPHSGAFLGNFPQAFTHLGIINSALYLAHAAGRDVPIPSPVGAHEHRIEAGHDSLDHP